MYKCLKADFHSQDERGELVQLVHEGYAQVNVLKSKKDAFRGGHYHKRSREAFYVVSGSVDVSFAELTGDTDQAHFAQGAFFEIPPCTVHSMSFPEDCVLLALYDRPVADPDGTMDIYRQK